MDISKTSDSPKSTMINGWKRQLLDHYKEDLLSAEQVQTIAAVVDLSTHSAHKKREMNQTQGMYSHSPLIDTGNRKSLP